MTLGVADICDRYRVGEHTVLQWIRRGELKAINVSKKTGGRPRWRVTEEALEAFEQLRASDPKPTATRRRHKSTDIISRY